MFYTNEGFKNFGSGTNFQQPLGATQVTKVKI